MPSMNEMKTGKAYWRSLDELADAPSFREHVANEFVGYQPDEIIESPTRRSMLKLMGASMALAGAGTMAGCRRWPEKELAPFTTRPEDRIPGVPNRYATAMELAGFASPLLVTSYDGRPIKIEGNPLHPMSRGAAHTFAQASILEMYDPERMRSVVYQGKVEEGAPKPGWGEAWSALKSVIGTDGAGFAILSEASSSPTIARLRSELSKKFPAASWHEYEAVSFDNETQGLKTAYGKSLRSQLDLSKAQVVVSLDADLLWSHPAALKHARDFVSGRDPNGGTMNRLYVAESTLSITGTNADRRLPIKSSSIPAVLQAIANGLAGQGGGTLEGASVKFVADAVADLSAAKGKAVIVAGPQQPAGVHALVAELNEKLQAVGTVVTYTAAEDRPNHVASIRDLAGKIESGAVKHLLILGGNPLFDAPADVAFDKAMAKLAGSFHLTLYANETTAASTWALPRSHYLECWSDTRSWDGTASVVQPLVLPLFDSRSPVQMIAGLLGLETSAMQLVRETFAGMAGVGGGLKSWKSVLRKGMLEGSTSKAESVRITGDVWAEFRKANAAAPEWEVVIRPDYSVFDGRFANNGWLQELPDPVTKVVWDNAASVSPADAKRLGVKHGDVITLHVGEAAADMPVYVLPGQAKGSIAVSLGYGREHCGAIGRNVGHTVSRIRSSSAMHIAAAAEPKKIARTYSLVTTQDHYAIDAIGMNERQERVDRLLVRTAPLEYYKEHHTFATDLDIHAPTKKNEFGRMVPLQVIQEPFSYENVHRWGMAIDLGKCIGCNACVIACQSENNIPIVGKVQVKRNREMHWIRIDRYFTAARKTENGLERVAPAEADLGDDSLEFHTVHQPVTCHQCETAPCEQVCPVAATVHDSEGLNVMIYNRCVGTRYCSNNCPYKVRRFNYFDWHSVNPRREQNDTLPFLGFPDQQQDKQVHPMRRMGFNPEVSVRMRGVMEKCTFCVQRIKAETIPALNEYRAGTRKSPWVEDGAITPACAQTCPTEAITFGNLNDPNSRVSKLFEANDRAYEMLKEINVRARTRYLARVTNPGHGAGLNPPAAHHHGGHEEHAAEGESHMKESGGH